MPTHKVAPVSLLRNAARLIDQQAESIFDGCKGVKGDGFVCGDCPAGNDVCKREHRTLVKVVEALRRFAA